MSTLKVDTILKRSGTGTITLGQSGDTLAIPAGANATFGGSGSTITIPSGSTIANAGTATGFGENNTPAFFAYRSSQQSTIGNETPTKIQFNAEIFDTDNAFDSTSNYRFTVPSGKQGKYFFTATARAVNTTGTGMRLSFYVNGTAKGHHAVSIADGTEAGGEGYHSVTNSFSLSLSASDYVEMYLWQKSGGNMNLHGDANDYGLTHFTGFRISS